MEQASSLAAMTAIDVVLENALFYAWSKNTAGNSNYDLRGTGECCLVPITRFERTQLRIERCGAGKCCLVPTITKFERTQL